MTLKPTERQELTILLDVACRNAFHSIEKAAKGLGIPTARLYDAVKKGYLEKLNVGDLRKLAAILPNDSLEKLRRWVLP